MTLNIISKRKADWHFSKLSKTEKIPQPGIVPGRTEIEEFIKINQRLLHNRNWPGLWSQYREENPKNGRQRDKGYPRLTKFQAIAYGRGFRFQLPATAPR